MTKYIDPSIEHDVRCEQYLVTATRLGADAAPIVLEEAASRREAQRIATRFRRHCPQYAAVKVEPIDDGVARSRIEEAAVLLRRHGPLGTCEVARRLRCKASAATLALRRAVARGLVEHVDGGRFGAWRAVGATTGAEQRAKELLACTSPAATT